MFSFWRNKPSVQSGRDRVYPKPGAERIISMTELKENKEAVESFKKAEESLEGAQKLLSEGLYDFSTSRAFFAIFYAVESALKTRNLGYKSQTDVIKIFEDNFVKSGIFSGDLQEYLIYAFALRKKLKEFGKPGAISNEKAGELISMAREVIDTVGDYLKKEGYMAYYPSEL